MLQPKTYHDINVQRVHDSRICILGYLTYKADVYSFGIVALEIVSCKHNMNFLLKNDSACLLD